MAARFAILTMLLLTAIAFAAASAKPPIVTVIKSDGTSVRGTLGNVDPKEVNITTVAKAGAQGEAVKLAWAEIKSLSNGMTQKRVIELWKKDHPEDLCETCHGEGKTICPTCHGTGRDPAAAKECPTCHGSETIACTTPKCDKGKIACPKMHLKLTEGTWVKKDDGLRWRKIPGRSGTREVSERHLGQIIEVQNGDPQSPIECPLCKGTMIIDDPKCHGTGLLPCNTCTTAVTKDPAQKCKDCEKGLVKCKTCDGTGLKSLSPAAAAP